MEIVVKIVEFTPIESGKSERGAWERRQVIGKTLDQDPILIAFTAMGRKVAETSKLQEGQIVRIRFGVSSRKVNDRWFSDIQFWDVKEV